MDDIWMLELLRKRGREDREFYNYMRNKYNDEMKPMYNKTKYYDDYDSWTNSNDYDDSSRRDFIRDLMYSPKDRNRIMRMMAGESSNHFTSEKAHYIVDQMHHTENGRKYSGEMYSYEKAKEVLNKYVGHIPEDVTACDVYVAINAQYHDYAQLFKTWFGSNIDHKIIDSAISFWFKDEDYLDGNKLMNYFNK